MKIKIAKFIADFLVDKGINHIFTVTGGGAMHLNDAFGHHQELKCIYNHHEQACSIAAEGYARLSGKIAGICVTSGPGGTNAITGVLGGWLDSIPMFILSGQVKRETTVWSTNLPLRQLGDQEFNICSCVSTMTKYAYMITEPEMIRYHLEKAWYLCLNGRAGPVWLDIPLDVQATIIETDELIGFDIKELNKVEEPKYDNNYTDKILEQIKIAKRPVILAGTGIRLANIHNKFIELINKLNIPVVTAWNAHDTLWDEHPLFCGRPGTVGTRGGNFVVQNSDLLLVLGCRLNIRQISYNYIDFAKDAYKIVIDIDATELKKPTLHIDMPIHANVKDVINALVKPNINNNDHHKKWLSWSRNINIKYPVTLPEYYKINKPVNPYVFITKLFEQLEEGDNIICGNGSACVIPFQTANIKKNQRMFTNSGCAAMGYGLPAALGCCVATNGNRVICIDGDGSFQMNIQDLQTIVYNKMNMKIFILNNNGYHSIRQTQMNLFSLPLIGVNDDNGISFPKIEKIANAYELPFIKIDTLENIEIKIKEIINTIGPIICEVVLDEKQIFAPKLSSKILPDGKIISPPIDDMFPFLSKVEYETNKKTALEI